MRKDIYGNYKVKNGCIEVMVSSDASLIIVYEDKLNIDEHNSEEAIAAELYLK